MEKNKNLYNTLRVMDIHISLDYDEDTLKEAVSKRLSLSIDKIRSVNIYKRSIDARKKSDVHFVFTLDVVVSIHDNINLEKAIVSPLKYEYKNIKCKKLNTRPLVVGSGPAGLFSALILAQSGVMPILIERGYDVDKRSKIVSSFWNNSILDEKCNVQFGEGGAGTFSDGKLTTGIKNELINKVLNELIESGAPEEILYLSKPHIGTDKLRVVVKNIRKRIESLGGEVRFGCKLTGIIQNDNKITGAILKDENSLYEIETDNIILAVGHSARDTFEMLYKNEVIIEQKAFSVGVRIEHSQEMINKSQYGKFSNHPKLLKADYKLSARLKNGRGVYTFCMCPGGMVVGSSSEKETVVTNGMSEFSRSKTNANSALLVGVGSKDFLSDHPLAGIEFQRKLERKAFEIAGRNYYAPVQRVEDFLNGSVSSSIGEIIPSYQPGYSSCNLSDCLPSIIIESMKQGILEMNKRLNGFSFPDAILTGVETRSSSPVRILRTDKLESFNLSGLYPCGEGAGYAGGIISAAIDGIKCAEAVLIKNI